MAEISIRLCVGGSCHLKNSRVIIDEMKSFISKNGLESRVKMDAVSCMGDCENSPCVQINGRKIEGSADILEKEILSLL